MKVHRRNRDQETSDSHVAAYPSRYSRKSIPDPILQLQRTVGNAALVRYLRRTSHQVAAVGSMNPLLRSFVQRDSDTLTSEPVSENATVDLDPQWLDTLSLEELTELKKIVESDVLIAQKDVGIDQVTFDTAKGNLKNIGMALASKLEARFNKLPQNVGIPYSLGDRIEFLDVMSAYLGSYDDVLTHYEDIKPANAPGNPMLHKNARAQLEAVSTELGGQIPSTTVGAHTRGRFHANNLQPMGHVLGFAIDYRAVDNPRIGDQDTLTLLRMDTGGKVNFDMGMSRDDRRAFIGEMRAGTADEKQMESFFTKFESEYDRVAKASEKFGETLGADAKTEMKALRDRYFKNLTDKFAAERRLRVIPRELKRKKNRDPDKQTALTEEQTQLTEQVTQIDEDQTLVLEEAQVILEPWIEELQKRKTEIEDTNPDVFNDAPVDEKSLSRKEKKRRDYVRGEWNAYDALEKRLGSDLAFLFGNIDRRGKPKPTVASQPSVTQLLERGFFNPDEEPTGKFAPHKHGFNLAFMKSMAKHGFDQGVCWSGTSQDSMHFEYVPDYDSVIGKKSTKTKLSQLKQIYYGKKKKPHRNKRRRK